VLVDHSAVGRRDAVPAHQHGQRAEVGRVEEHEQRRDDERRREQVRHREHAEPRRDRQARQHDGVDEVGHDHHPLAVDAVGQRAGRQAEQQVGQRLERGDQGGEQRGATRDVVHHDGQRDVGDRGPGERHQPGAEEAAPVGVVAQPGCGHGGVAHRNASAWIE
jgi:hypothetical protein